MIRSSSRTLYKLYNLYKTPQSFSSLRRTPLTSPLAPTTAVRRFVSDVTKLNNTEYGSVGALALLRSRFGGVAIGRSNVGGYDVRAKAFSSKASRSTSGAASETRKEVTTAEDPFDSITDNIPEKPLTFTEGASYSVVILVGLGIAALAGYGVVKELIFEPKEYKVFNKALRRIQDDSQVRVRIGSPITGYGQESRNRAARQRVPNRVWKDEDGVEHVEVRVRIGSPITGYGQESRNRAARQRVPNRVWKDEDGVEHVEVTSLNFYISFHMLALYLFTP
ncbi:probable mitochondrial import inner membrane translocase subunit TIM21 [Tanacetum coccineum]